MTEVTAANAVMEPVFAALRDFDPSCVRAALDVAAPDCVFRLCHPIGDLRGPASLMRSAYAPLHAALPDLERQEFIRMAG
ncbi:MAG TPA: polyketide cyclase, partial [Marivita sp.]|nr:polyketide cyclase [Marivita sp.]